MTESEALVMGAQLVEWMNQSTDARLAVKGVVLSCGYGSIGEMAIEDPETFELLYESVKDMMEQIPTYWTP